MPKTLFDKVWDQHIVETLECGHDVLFIERHYIHEVTSPQAFAGLRKRGIGVYDTQRIIATADHNVPTVHQHLPIKEKLSRHQVETLTKNCEEFGIEVYGLGHPNQGIVHVIGPEMGATLPGMTIVCGDSHTSTHGAFGTIAFGIGTSQVEQVLATQCLIQSRPKTMRINIDGRLNKHVLAKDIILFIISKMSASGGTGYFIEFAGSTIDSLSMESRMTICNMSIEMGARGGLIAPDETTFEYLKGREMCPQGADFDRAVAQWKLLRSEDDAKFDKEISFTAEQIQPMITYGTNPGMGIPISGQIPNHHNVSDQNALKYMMFNGGENINGKKIDHVFIGSCTNGRIEDLRVVANYVRGKKKSDRITAWIVPGSKKVEQQAIAEGLDKIFEAAGFDFREPGCSACLAMNEDKVPAGKYCVSTSNRNFEGRQGQGSRTLLASPLVAAAAAIEGKIVNPN